MKAFVTSGNDFHAARAVFLPLPINWDVVSQPVNDWKPGRAKPVFLPSFLKILRVFPDQKQLHRSMYVWFSRSFPKTNYVYFLIKGNYIDQWWSSRSFPKTPNKDHYNVCSHCPNYCRNLLEFTIYRESVEKLEAHPCVCLLMVTLKMTRWENRSTFTDIHLLSLFKCGGLDLLS